LVVLLVINIGPRRWFDLVFGGSERSRSGLKKPLLVLFVRHGGADV
jgi:hypothetical protein